MRIICFIEDDGVVEKILRHLGLWETRNPQGDFFGKQPVYDLIRRHSHEPASAIVEHLLTGMHRFRGAHPLEDDVTLVVIKIKSLPDIHAGPLNRHPLLNFLVFAMLRGRLVPGVFLDQAARATNRYTQMKG